PRKCRVLPWSRAADACGTLPDMSLSAHTAEPDRWIALATAALERPRSPLQALPQRLIVADATTQRLALVEDGRVMAEYPASTAYLGIGGESGSQRTPPCWPPSHPRVGRRP